MSDKQVELQLLKAKAQARLDEARVKGVKTLRVELDGLESNLLSRLAVAAAIDMLQDFEEAEDDDQRINVLVARNLLTSIAEKFKAAHEAAGPLGAPFGDNDKPLN